MSNIGGKKRESNNLPEFTRKVGLFEAKVIAVNPTIEEYKDILGMELKEDSKAVLYLGESQDKKKTLRLDFWLEEIKSKDKLKVTFFLENKIRENKEGTKRQYINAVGTTSWADDENNLLSWFTAREYREAFVGEEELYEFVKVWLGNLDYKHSSTSIEVDFKKLMNGNVRDLKAQIDGEWATNIVAMATIITKEKDGETKEYQGVYNRMFLPTYALKQFRNVDYSKSPQLVNSIAKKKSKDCKGAHEKFINKLAGEYGCKDYYSFKEFAEYNSDDNLVASDAAISDDGLDF